MTSIPALKEPFSGLSHGVAALLSVVGLVLLAVTAAQDGTVWHVVSFSVFGVSLVLLYTSSSLYHLLHLSVAGEKRLRRLDHTMIYVLIAGTYTPLCLVPLRGPWGWSLLVAIWSLAAIGIALKWLWLDAPRWATVGPYLIMGWLCVVAIKPMMDSLPSGGLAWIGAGGLFYTVGAVGYALKRPDPWPGVFGFHEIWHLFVIGGSLSHWWAVFAHVRHV